MVKKNTVAIAEVQGDLLSRLPQTRGRLRANADLSETNWFRVGGPAEVLFKPEDVQDLAHFLQHKPLDVPVTVIGVGSNLLVRDGGIEGVVIRLGRGFTECKVEGTKLTIGAACLSVNAALFAQQHAVAGLEFLSGIPGTIGGALAMNGGAYGSETADLLLEAEVVTNRGEIKLLPKEFFNFAYRHCALPKDWIFTHAVFEGRSGDATAIADRIAQISAERNLTQPVRSRTGGSTFKNPPGRKAWELIDKAGCRGLKMGAAQVSELHCNFLINTGGATAQDLESLGEEVRRRAKENSGIELEWEIRRLGKHHV